MFLLSLNLQKKAQSVQRTKQNFLNLKLDIGESIIPPAVREVEQPI